MTKIDDMIAADTITLTRAEFEVISKALEMAESVIKEALTILSKHGETK